jgi:2-isopropylmalate synthase
MARVKAVVELNLSTPILSHARACVEDVQRVADAGARWVGIFAGVNTLSRTTRLSGRSHADVIRLIGSSVEFGKRRGLNVRYTLEDASRTPRDQALDAFRAALDSGADRLCFADTVGALTPDEIWQAIRFLADELGNPSFEVHIHDDRGLAVASALKAIDAGVRWISASVNGLGERSGIVDTATLAANLDVGGPSSRWNFGSLQELSTLVGAISREHPDARRPVIGKYAFTHSAKLHADAVSRDEMAYSWRAPSSLARSTSIAAPALDDVLALINKAVPICATELPHHRRGPGTRYVMLDDRFVPNAKQYCIVREIPPQDTAPTPHVDAHRHNVDSIFVFIGSGERLTGLTVSVKLGATDITVESPSSVLIPGGLEHSYSILNGSGYFIHFVNAGDYASSLLKLAPVRSAPAPMMNQSCQADLTTATARGMHAAMTTNGRANGVGLSAMPFEEFALLVAEFVANRSGKRPAEIAPDFDYVSAGLLDSLGLAELFFYVEDTLDRKFQAEELRLERLSTAARFYAFVQAQ